MEDGSHKPAEDATPKVRGNFYIINGEQYARVTSVIEMADPDTSARRGLDAWKERVGAQEAERVAAETAGIGDKIHDITYFNDINQMRTVERMIKEDPWLVPFWVAWFDWTGRYIIRWVAREVVVWSKKMKVAGRIDGVGVIKGDRNATIVDIKTGSLHDDIGVQVEGAYLTIYNEWKPKGWPRADRALVVHLPRKNPGHLSTKSYSHPKYKERFEEAVQLYYKLTE